MTRNKSKSRPEAQRSSAKPKLKKETLQDLDPKRTKSVRGGTLLMTAACYPGKLTGGCGLSVACYTLKCTR